MLLYWNRLCSATTIMSTHATKPISMNVQLWESSLYQFSFLFYLFSQESVKYCSYKILLLIFSCILFFYKYFRFDGRASIQGIVQSFQQEWLLIFWCGNSTINSAQPVTAELSLCMIYVSMLMITMSVSISQPDSLTLFILNITNAFVMFCFLCCWSDGHGEHVETPVIIPTSMMTKISWWSSRKPFPHRYVYFQRVPILILYFLTIGTFNVGTLHSASLPNCVQWSFFSVLTVR